MQDTKIIVTSALPYVHGIPHLGNLVGSVLPADVYFKYLKMANKDAIFICGSDQHGTPIELEAIKQGIEPQEFADSMHKKIKSIFEKYECTFTYYGKTHTEENKETTYEFFDALDKNGYIVEKDDMQAYCEIDKRFLVDRLIEGTCPYCGGKARGDQCDSCGRLLEPTQLIDPHCTICGKNEITFKKVKNLAIALDKLEAPVLEFIEKNSKNWSKNAANKATSFIKTEGLRPRDITRNMKWGFPVMKEGFKNQVFYVWFDAVLGYIGITKEWNKEKWKEYWLGNARLIQFMGKDNIEFHTIMFPAMLIGARKGYTMPAVIKASEYLTSKTLKFSKSNGIGLNLEKAIEIMDADYWRFALMYLYPESSDTAFSIPIMNEIVNSIMNDKIGNLVNRVMVLIKRSGIELNSYGKGKYSSIDSIQEKYIDYFEKINLKAALQQVIAMAELGNQIMSSEEPWKIKDKAKLSEVLSALSKVVYSCAIMLWPFTPNASKNILAYYGINDEPKIEQLKGLPSLAIENGSEIKPIFRKMGEEQIKALRAFE